MKHLMSLQNATEFIQRLSEDSDLAARVQSKEDAVRVAGELGTPFTTVELEQAIADSELSNDDLKRTAGGLKPLW